MFQIIGRIPKINPECLQLKRKKKLALFPRPVFWEAPNEPSVSSWTVKEEQAGKCVKAKDLVSLALKTYITYM